MRYGASGMRNKFDLFSNPQVVYKFKKNIHRLNLKLTIIHINYIFPLLGCPMNVTKAEVDGGVLVGHGLLLPTSLFLEKKLAIDEGRLLDFGALLNSLVLHDKLVTLPATIPNHILQSGLYRYLRERGLLTVLKISYDEFEVNQRAEMMDLFRVTSIPKDGVANDPENLLEDGNDNDSFKEEANIVLGDLRYAYKYIEKWDEEKYKKNEEKILLKRSRLIEAIITSKHEDWITTGASNPLLGSTEEGMRLHSLRTAVYWEISGMCRIPFMPDFLRIPIITGYNQRLSQSIRIILQNKIDSLNRKEKEEAPQFIETMTIPLPAIPSKFLNLYKEKQYELSETLDALREEFGEHRKVIVDWEERMRKASPEEEQKVWKEISSSIESLKSRNESEIIANAALDVGEDLLSGSLKLDTATKLGRQVFTILKRFLARRNINYYYTGMKDANKIKDQYDLLKDTFGSSLTEIQSQRFVKLATCLNELTTRPLV